MSAQDPSQQFARWAAACSPRGTRSQSVSSDRPSTASSYTALLSPPPSISPVPMFIAPSAASQIVTNDHDSRVDAWLDQHGIEPSGETALVSGAALNLVNKFLDQILFNFLSSSRSTSLATLRPAVSEVLKPKLARDAISGADDELREYLGGSDDEELLSSEQGGAIRDWDLELVWKRTRLRCMVYSSLGDMEEEDEDRYAAEGNLDGSLASSDFRESASIVSPAVAIFLTSILEFMGEQVLVVGGQAAYSRLRTKHEREEREGIARLTDIADRVIVEEADMERVALDRTLGRLWRGWKKRVRTPKSSISTGRTFMKDSIDSQAQPGKPTSNNNVFADNLEEEEASSEVSLTEFEQAVGIPLPMSVDDIREIEIPGVAPQSDYETDDADSEVEEIPIVQRPKSLVIFTNNHNLPTPNSSQPPTPIFLAITPRSRKRANSLPPPAPAPLTSLSSRRPRTAAPGEVDSSSSEAQIIDSRLTGTITPAESDKDAVENDEGHVSKNDVPQVGTVEPVAETVELEDTSKDAMESDDEFIIEEPQIITSSRISISGRISPDDKDLSSHSSLRSPSIHSLRLIDVNAGKSPTRSRQSSIDGGSDYISSGRAVSISRPSSLHSPVLTEIQSPRGSSPHHRGPIGPPLARNSSNLSMSNNANETISEVDEKSVGEEVPLSAVPADLAAAMQGVDVEPSPTSQNFVSTHVLKADGPRSAPFVLSAPPTPQSYRVNNNKVASSRNGILNPKVRGHEVPDVFNTPQATSKVCTDPPPRSTSRTVGNTLSERGTSLARVVEHGSPETVKSVSRTSPVQRSSPPRSSRESSRMPLRPSYASTSSSSSTSKVKPIRTSDDSVRTTFDQLIQGGETIQYTLTPQNMRNIEGPDSAAALAAMTASRPVTGRSHSSSVSKHTGLNSNPPTDLPKNLTALKPPPSRGNNSTKSRSNAPQPRDARADRDSLGDFSEFIRSTGPPNILGKEPPPKTSGGSSTNSSFGPLLNNSHKGTKGTSRNVSGSAPRVGPVAALPRRAESSAGRSNQSRLQARDATVGNDSITDLIDFVRAGPEDKESHRIPRTVAPFRSTMDSDQMVGLVGGKAIDATLPDARYSQASTQASTQVSTSTHHSINSQTALLASSSKPNKPTPGQSSMDFDDEDMMPKRKTRRVRDPYAIDFSDEEDEFDEGNFRPAPIQEEESLADFLRNVPPPPSPKMTPMFDDAPPKPPKKKASFSSRFGRSGSTSHPPPLPKTTHSVTRSVSSKHAPINPQFSSPPSAHGGQRPSPPARSNTGSTATQKMYQPREATNFKSKTSDLADFLRDSEPPVAYEPKPFIREKEEHATFASRMFGRRKKTNTGF